MVDLTTDSRTPGLDAVLAAVGTDRGAMIEALKGVVRHKARWAGVPFDEEDVQDFDVGEGYHLVALMSIKTPHLEEVDGELVEVDAKTPNIWLEWPPPYVWDENGYTHRVNPQRFVYVTVPTVRVRNDWLCYLIGPDGRVVTGSGDVIAMLNEQARRYAEDTFCCPTGWVKQESADA